MIPISVTAAVWLFWLMAQPTGGAILPRYACSGATPSGRYQLTLTIEPRGETHLMTWTDEHIEQFGVGIRDGSRLIVGFSDAHTGAPGVAIYQVEPGQLLGVWAFGDGAMYSEMCLAGRPA